MNKTDLTNYLTLLTKTITIGSEDTLISNDISDEYTIPISLISEENMAHKFMENTKASIRSSIEYKKWVKAFKENYNPVVCSVSDNTVTIEVHHHPFTLEDYVELALAIIYNNHLTYTTHLIADLVMRWHFMDYVGACYMSKTYHKRYHDEHDIVINEDCIYGNVKGFLNDELIKPYITEHMLDKLSVNMPELYREVYK